jgi:hypothetical protein
VRDGNKGCPAICGCMYPPTFSRDTADSYLVLFSADTELPYRKRSQAAASGKPDLLRDLLEAGVGTETVKHRLGL